MSERSDRLLKACAILGLQVEIGFSLLLSDGHVLRSIARVASLGAENGMLLFHSFEQVRAYAGELIQAGYGYSILDEPRPDEEFELESFIEMFADWGWTGDAMAKPKWMSSAGSGVADIPSEDG